jgi:Mlc titration factor MtfA (ptsG expression regulator)
LLLSGVYVVTKAFDIVTGRSGQAEGENKNPIVRAIEWLTMWVCVAGLIVSTLAAVGCALFGPIYLIRTDQMSVGLGIVTMIFIWGFIVFVIFGNRISTFLAKRRQQRRWARFQGKRLSSDRQKRLRENVPHYVRLPDELKPKLEECMLLFLDQVKFDAKGTQKCTEEIRDMVAAEACLLIVNRSILDYCHFNQVILWPGPVEGDENVAGRAGRKCVQLNWDGVWRNRKYPEDNYNVILHEFAHVLDQADDAEAQSIPVPPGSEEGKAWKTLLDREYPRLEKDHKRYKRELRRLPVIGDYAVSDDNRAEFFTCATESFFEKSTELREQYPEVYKALKNFYQLDPAEWQEN